MIRSRAPRYESLETGGWTISVGTDTALETSMRRAHEQLHMLKRMNNPELRIGAYDLIVDSRKRPVQKIAEVFVAESNEENRNLNGTEIEGWKVRVPALYENKRAGR